MADAKETLVGIVLGSDSDIPTVESATKTLDDFGIGYELRIFSAHRTPEELATYVRDAASRSIKVFIAAAGMSAALPGVIAAHTHLPVLGIPVPSGTLGGLDALLAVSQMPPGVPVAAMTIGSPGARNAALLAIRILALSDPSLVEKLKTFIAKQRDEVLAKDAKFKR